MQIQSTRWISAVALALVGATVLSGVGLSGAFKSETLAAESAVSTVSVDIAPVCSMIANVTSVHDATLVAGSYSGTYVVNGGTPYANGIGSTTLTAFCNDASGYAIYAVGYTGNTFGDTTMIGNTSGLTIATGTATSGNTSQWAMKLIKVTDGSISYLPNNLTIEGGFDNYHTVPNAYTKVVSYSSRTDGANGLGSKVMTTYAAYVQPEQISDTYVGQVKYTLVHPSTNDPNSFVVNFYANGGSGSMTSQKITSGVATALNSSTFTAPAGKFFDGWNTAADGSGTSYANQAQVTDLAAGGETIALYAQWGLYMQGGSAVSTTLPNIGDTTTAYDTRDGQAYTIARLADGKIWMTKNLNIAGGTALSSDDTDFESTYVLPTDCGWTVSNNKLVLPASSSSGFSYPGAECARPNNSLTRHYAYVYNTGNNTNNCETSGCYSYYSWDVATLGSGREIDAPGVDAEYSVCPKGWRLPVSGGHASNSYDYKRGDLYRLGTAYGVNLEGRLWSTTSTFYDNAGPGTLPNFILTGRYKNGSFEYGEYDDWLEETFGYGFYLASTTDGNSGGMSSHLVFGEDFMGVTSNSGYEGFAVRCIFKE